MEVGLHAESALVHVRVEHLHLLLNKLIVLTHFHCEGVLVRVVVQVNEAVVQEEPSVTFLAVGVINLLTTLYVLKSLNNEALPVVGVRPTRLPRPFVVKHVGVGDKAIRLGTLDLDAKYAARHHHPNLRVLLKRELPVLWHLRAYHIVVLLDVADFFTNLVLERTALQPRSFLLCVENREVVERFGQNVDVLIKEGALLAALLHHIGR